MGILFDLENAKRSEGHMASNGGCVCPVSFLATDELLLVIEYINKLGDSTTLNTPTVNGVSGTLRAATTGTSIYSFAGATSGTALFTFSTNPASFRAFFVKISGQKSSSPYSAGYSAITSGLSHQIIAGSTAPFPGAVLFGAIGLSGLPDTFGAGVGFDSPDSIFSAYEEFNYNPNDGNFYPIFALNVAIRYAEDAGDTGALVWSSIGWNFPVGPYAFPGGIAAFWISPLQAPSAPTVYAPEANAKATVGSDLTIAWTSATDPNVDSEDLTYDVYVSNNNGLDYGSPLTTTAAGVLSYVWDTTGFPAGNYKVKVVGNNGSDDGDPGYSGSFQLFADTVPGAPTNLSPSGYISQAARTFTWVAVNPDFDTQSHYELEWSTNANMSSSSTTGTITSTTSSHAFSASTDILTPVGIKYWRVRTKGAVDGTFGAWSAVQTVIVSAAPATPTITSSSTANTAIWPVTFTAIAHVQFRHRWILFGDERFNGIVQSSGFGFTSPFNLANGDVWTVKVSVFDPVTGLESAEASQTLTVTYTGPNAATLEVTALSSIGAFQIAITNSDAVDHVRIYRASGGDFMLISPKLEGNSTYLDYQVAHDLDTVLNEYVYMVRSFKPTTLGYTDSAPSDGIGIQLSELHISVVDKLSTTANASLSVAIPIEGKIKKRFVKKHVSVGNKGRTKFITRAGQAKHTELIYNCKIPQRDTTTFPALQAVCKANRTLFFSDQAGNKIFGRILNLPKTDSISNIAFTLTCIEGEHQEEQAR